MRPDSVRAKDNVMLLTRLNRLTDEQRGRLVRSLVPEAVWGQHARLVEAGLAAGDADDLQAVCRPVQGELKLRSPAARAGRDFAFLLDLDERDGGEIELAFIQINDLMRARYDIDVDEDGLSTLLGTARRNIAAEVRAMEAGLGPGQVRHGLGCFAEFMGRLSDFCQAVGCARIQLQPLTYHNALMYERAGFAYTSGRAVMERIDAGFQPGGDYFARLDGSTPFRRPEAAGDQRLRSWAIHDGVLGHPMPELRMHREIGRPCELISTFTSPPSAGARSAEPDPPAGGGA